MKRAVLSAVLTLTAVLCRPRLERYTVTFWGSFDTMTQITARAASRAEFDALTDAAIARFSLMGRYYDRFREYPGMVNLATLNRNADGAAREIPPELYNMLRFAQWGAAITHGAVAPEFGPVTELWRRAILSADAFGEGEPPDSEQLCAAARRAEGGRLLLDSTRHTAALADGTLLDVGAVAKGYAIEQLARSLADTGLYDVAVSGGGTVRAMSRSGGGWRVGIQDPGRALMGENAPLATLRLRDAAVATSGDYQRCFWHDGVRLHHLIDRKTCYPAHFYRSVTVVADHAGLADLLSTALYLLDPSDSAALAEQCGVAAYWVFSDGTTEANADMKKRMG